MTRVPMVYGGIFLLGLVVHAAWSWGPSFWYDEAATLRLAALPWGDFFLFIEQRDAVHAAYAAVMRIWIAVFGESEFIVRLPSAVAVGVAASGVLWITRRVGGSLRGGAFAATAFTFLPRVVLQGVEARSYMVSTALVVIGAILILVAREKSRFHLWLTYILVAALAIWFFAYAILVLPALALLADLPDAHRGQRIKRAILTIGLPAILASPLLLMMVGQQGQIAWLNEQELSIWTILIDPLFSWAFWIFLFSGVLLVRGAIYHGRFPTNARLAFLAWLALPTIVLVTISVMYQPMFAPRYVTVCAPPLAILLGLSVSRWSWRAVIGAAAIWILASAPIWVVSRLPDSKPGGTDYRAVAETIGDRATPGDSFVLGATGTGALRPRVALMAYPAEFEGLLDIARIGAYEDTGTYWDDVKELRPQDLTQVERLWVATRGEDSRLVDTLQASGFHPIEIDTIDGIEILCWVNLRAARG